MKITKVDSCEKKALQFSDIVIGGTFKLLNSQSTLRLYIKVDANNYICSHTIDPGFHPIWPGVELGAVIKIEICEIIYKDKD